MNTEYFNKRTKLRITSALHKDTPQDIEHTVKSIDEDRKPYLQAAIVRIMKSRKILKHNQLVNEVSNVYIINSIIFIFPIYIVY